MIIIEVLLYLKKLIVCVVSLIVAHATKISMILSLGVGFFSLNLLFQVKELSKRVSFVLQKYEERFAEKALETPIVVQESSPFLDPVFKPMICVCFLVMLYLMYATKSLEGDSPAVLSERIWSNHPDRFIYTPSIPEVGVDIISVENASTLNNGSRLVESTPTDSLTLIPETLSSSVTPELVTSVLENLPV